MAVNLQVAFPDPIIQKIVINRGVAGQDGEDADVSALVAKADYTPTFSILVQQSGTGSPEALSIGTNTLVGRVTGGGSEIDNLSPATVRTLLNVENGATADQTGSEIKTAYELEDNTNAFTDAEKTLLGNQSGTNTGDLPRVDAIINGKTDSGGGDQFLFGNFTGSGGWSEAHSDADIGLANNYHAWWGANDPVRVEFEADQGEMQFYIEAGTGKDAWYGYQESATTVWSHGHDQNEGTLSFCTGFGLTAATTHFSLDNSTGTARFIQDSISGHHYGDATHRQFAVINDGDTVLQVSGNNAGGVGTAICMSNMQSTSDGRHWVFQNRGSSDGNRLEIGYKTTSTSGENIVGTVSELFGIATDGKVSIQKLVLSGVPTSDPTNAGEVWNDSGTLKISAG